MTLSPDLISTSGFVSAGVVTVVCLLLALVNAPWSALLARSERQHIFFASTVFLPLFWMMNIKIQGVVDIHLLGITALALMLGWALCILVGVLSQLIYCFLSDASVYSLPVNTVFTVIVPATTTYCLLWFVSRWQFKNLFAYLLGVGFAGGVLSVLVVGLLLFLCILLSGEGPLAQWGANNFPFVLMLGFPEGFINGTVVTAVTVFYPELMKTFDEHHYLSRDNGRDK